MLGRSLPLLGCTLGFSPFLHGNLQRDPDDRCLNDHRVRCGIHFLLVHDHFTVVFRLLDSFNAFSITYRDIHWKVSMRVTRLQLLYALLLAAYPTRRLSKLSLRVSLYTSRDERRLLR